MSPAFTAVCVRDVRRGDTQAESSLNFTDLFSVTSITKVRLGNCAEQYDTLLVAAMTRKARMRKLAPNLEVIWVIVIC